MKYTICMFSVFVTLLAGQLFPQQAVKGLDQPTAQAGVGGGLKVTAYGQLASNGEDLSQYGKVLKLSFRLISDSVGMVDVSGGVAGKRFGVHLGIRKIESRLPWHDTILCDQLVASGGGVFDAQGQVALPLDLAGLYPDKLIVSRLDFYLQAVSLGEQDQPLSSHGLAFEVCRTPGDTSGTDHDQWTISDERYRSHQVIAQLTQGFLGVSGWRAIANVSVPSAGWTFAHDRTVRANGKTHVLLSLTPPDQPAGGPVSVSVTVDLGAADPGSVRVHIADVIHGAPRLYQLAVKLR